MAVVVPGIVEEVPSQSRSMPRERRAGPLMPSRPKPPDHEDLIDMTAMVDIVFFLLIFFMVASLAAQQASIKVPSPEPSDKPSTAPVANRSIADYESDEDYVIVRIDSDNLVWVEDLETRTPADLAVRLRDELSGRGSNPDGAHKMLVVAHGSAHHGTGVMVLDTGHEVGMEEVRLKVVDEEP
jgi:biopolymer transport protein ExbD